MLKQKWPYVRGAAQKGCVDCSGAFVYAYKQHGESIYHGSNRIARVYVEKLLPMSECKPGYAVFKLRKPGDKKYALPAAYKPGGAYYNGDLNDYYHIGLMGRDGWVMNAQSASTGFVNSHADGWACCGRLKDADYSESPVTTATVVAKSGSSVNLRECRSKSSRLVMRIPLGSEVIVDGEVYGGWYPVRYKSAKGYIMEEYLCLNS